MKHLAPISYKADLIGNQLKVDSGFIEGLKLSMKSNETKLIEVLQKWREMEPSPVTLENIIEVIGGPVVQSKNIAFIIFTGAHVHDISKKTHTEDN